MDIRTFLRMGFQHLKGRHAFRHADSFGLRSRMTGSRISVRNDGTMHIAERVQFISTLVPIDVIVEKGGTLTIGESCYFNYGCSISAMQEVTIGKGCLFGTYVSVTDNAFHELSPEHRLERPASMPVIIEDNVWLANRVVVLPGVTIGAGSAIGACSVVTKDIPPRTLAVGIPAKPIRQL